MPVSCNIALYYIFQGENMEGEPEVVYDSDSFAAQLLKHGSNPNAIEPESGSV